MIGKSRVVAFIAAVVVSAMLYSAIPLFSAKGESIANTTECVSIGEPLYPTPQTIPLHDFVSTWQNQYVVTVNETAHLVTVFSPRGGIGAITASTLKVPIVGCR